VVNYISDRSITVKKLCEATHDGKNTALSSDTGLSAGGIELCEGLRCVGGYATLSVDSFTCIARSKLFWTPSRTVLAADGGKVEHVELAALRNTAGAEGRVDLGQGDGSACGEGEDGGGELHAEYDWGFG
jgi:hypothetical protein